MEINCQEVVRELSNYIDEAVDPALRREIAAHLSLCKHCTAIYDGTKNVIRLVGDERTFELPAGFGDRLRSKLAKESAKG